ncbi:PLP-dependent aminotransferase family protein [uncultured Streptococcus sp.]|uniref:aminotransferase-like domain-containing protein n=1 Tax=uncultured Streptococcus sp. TaxID=83427 RepID=UPI0027DBFF78|nr:PLP-dependent aminotransferase family protein [uncultured Streptococcus sp.]
MTKLADIKQYLIGAIEDGQLAPGDRMPSIRQLAQQFSCNKDTAQRALLELKFERYIYAKPRSGYYVFDLPNQEVEPVDLPESEVANDAYEDFRLCLNETLIGREDYLFNYYHRQEGLPDLIEAVHGLLADSGVYVPIEHLVITAGSQQALYILNQLAFPNGKTEVVVEEPTYSRMLDLLEEQGLVYHSVARDLDGLDFETLEHLFRTQPIKFFYLIPRLHNPLGTSYSPTEMRRLVALAERYDVYLVEDDYMSDFANQSPLHYYDTKGRVIYLKSFSNTVFSALRLATICLPHDLKSPFIAYKKLMDYDTNLILQKALALYIENGLYAKNIKRLRAKFQQRLENWQERLASYAQLPEYSIHQDQLIVKLPPQIKLWQAVAYGDAMPQSYRQLVNEHLLRLSDEESLKALLKYIL